MDTKRKANGAAAVETPDRASKRRKLAEFDLAKGETRESTTAYGLSFLEQIRRTADKSGRLVATYFEHLLPRQGNSEYYKRTRMPISLETIENKLEGGEFENLAELESYFKRMIANAKEFYPRSSSTFDDAERLRKALSNYMTKTNPAYHLRGGYSAVPTPFPEDAQEDEDEDAEGEDEEEEGGDEDVEEEEDADEEKEEEDEEPSSRKRSIILKRRGPGRPTRAAATTKAESPRASAAPSRPDHQFENVPYKGLSFQQAQEKLIEELLRHQEPEYDDAYFEPFINLPPRALRDYYKVITDPLSIKKLQKMVKGVHGRGEVTGTSDFKTWSAFQEKSTLLWTNAFFYNEEGSEIYGLAQELEKFFTKELKKAQTAVPEPTPAKIKLKVGTGAESTPSSKKITIHVGGRGEPADSPAPQVTQSTDAPTNGQPINGIRTSTPGQPNLGQLDKATRSLSTSVPSPSPSTHAALKAEDVAAASPAGISPPAGTVSAQAAPVVGAPVPAVQSQPVQHNPLANGYMEQKRYRGAGKTIDDALISSVRVQLHPAVQIQSPTIATVRPHPTEMVQSATVNLPAHLARVLIIPLLPDLLRTRQYSLWTVVNKQPLKPSHQQVPGQLPQERAFEAMLHPGINVIETHLIAAVPRNERVPGGPEVELEVFTIFVNVLRN
ncbi:Bromodomain-containing protein [Dactylonectria macrodidyma]|uniref:Bromodomain-containing protein n=1 Tax=Dactylonectria macrodidyma TaxID=307937 RepID=A0A9P9F6N0_9HYPO|nr:Bromodomain-containing protein [Dactylonectria macrodidyma]